MFRKMKINKYAFGLGIILLIISIFLATVFSYSHYYSFFSIGLFILFLELHKLIFKRNLFNNWHIRQHVIFWTTLIVVSYFLDQFGLDAGYWVYPHYSTIFDEIIKIVFEWAVPFVYLMIVLIIGTNIFRKKFRLSTSFMLSLILFVTIAGLLTEWVNLSVFSWKIIDMPISDYKIGEYYIIFQTFGYWSMAVISYLLLILTERFKKNENKI